jgi:hypothetical protein
MESDLATTGIPSTDPGIFLLQQVRFRDSAEFLPWGRGAADGEGDWMAQTDLDGGGWWAEVEHLREPLERRRAERIADEPRRTVKIRGQAIAGTSARQLYRTAESPAPRVPDAVLRRDRPRRTAPDRLGSNPDRIAAWAVVFGVLMALIAAGTAHGAVPSHATTPAVQVQLVAAPAPPSLLP